MIYDEEIKRGERFYFGKNWSQLLSVLEDKRIEVTEASLRNMLGLLAWKRKPC